MKKNLFITVIAIIYSLSVLSMAWYFLYENHLNEKNNQQNIINAQQETFTGNTFDPDYIISVKLPETWASVDISDDNTNTGSIILSDIDRINNFQENWFYRIYNPPKQPNVKWSYEAKSATLNAFIAKNTFHFTTTSKLSEWYLLIKTEKPLKNNEDIFLYFYNTDLSGYPVSGKLSKNDNLWNPEKWEYLYAIDNIPIYKFYDKKLINYNWMENELHKIKKVHFIAWYITTSSDNSIKEIIVAWQ